ncbi:polysaccharide pyruvyl transferase family protein [Brachyspira hyodysenteriae]|uniref:polysaccharide pyruvyl transferase family protein n=1 Tax=Brachyspira hyodysenteriae TaxID=159 RepID=UPI0022CDDBAE|nr:polysaccharide pyruvyl transferase family protein [Brachyspira hyodysenteriae]MCZ9888763.1 polysaccharide pyruvyl transferase family protein [Brachyspira hyodysenteriae]
MNIYEIINKIVWWIPFKNKRNDTRLKLIRLIEDAVEKGKKVDRIRYYNIITDILSYNNSNVEKIFYFSTPEYPNIGDNAITYATNKILKELFKDKIVLEYTNNDFMLLKDVLFKFVKDNDIIILNGGGNFGNLWIYHEYERREIISRLKNNRIIIFPQSIYFTDDNDGKKELEVSQKIYNSHKNLTIMTRDLISYRIAKEYFYNNNILLSPDIVFSLMNNINIDRVNRKGILFLLRNDKEKLLDDLFIEKIKEYLDLININYCLEDNIFQSEVKDFKIERENIVINQLKNISKYNICITDRFHGAIFSYITNTPCIVFKSLYHKIEYGLEWIKESDSISYISDNDDIEYVKVLIDKYLNMKINNNISFDKQIKEQLLTLIK